MPTDPHGLGKKYPSAPDFATTPAERRLLQQVRALKSGVYLAGITIAGGGVYELVLFNTDPAKKRRIGD